MRKIILLLVLSLTALVTPAFAENMNVERVRYCKTGGIQNICDGNGGETSPNFAPWAAHGVGHNGQLETYISIINEPSRDQVKKVVFISAGQQSDSPNLSSTYGDGYQNVLTGQPDNYKHGCDNQVRNCTRSIDSRSLAGRLRASGKFDDSDTLFISVLDARFGFFRPIEELQKRENAFWDLLTSRFDPNKVELISLSGQSRGGCLVFRLGSRFRKTSAYKNIPLIVQGYDPVCTNPSKGDGIELPTVNYIKNPLNLDKFSYILDIDQIFPVGSRENLKALVIHGGGKVAGSKDIRSFTWKTTDVDSGWWQQKWVNREHNEMGGNYSHAWEIGDIGYGHIYNYVSYELGRPEPTNYRATAPFPVDVNGDRLSDIVLIYQDPSRGLTLHTKIAKGDGEFQNKRQVLGDGVNASKLPLLSGYFNADDKSDILVREQHPSKGLILRTKISNGDGTFTGKEFVSGDGAQIGDMPAFIGDVNGDGLSDVILRYQHPSDGLYIRTKTSNGDGTFTAHNFKAGDGNLGPHLRAHVGDVNKDKKTDLVYLYKRSSDGNMEIRTRISNGDGTFGYKKSAPIKWINWQNLETFMADVNRDRRSDLIVLNRSHDGDLSARTYFSNGDGTYRFESDQFSNGTETDAFEAVVADINGDYRTDIVLRERHSTRGLLAHVKQSDGNGKFTNVTYELGDGAAVDKAKLLTGNFDAGGKTDVVLRYRHSNSGLKIRTKFMEGNGQSSHHEYSATDGVPFDKLDALSGSVRWSGGGTFELCQGAKCLSETVVQSSEQAVKGLDIKPVPVPTGPLTPESTEMKTKVIRKPIKKK